ncbi:MAG: DUF6817 domain-containing protein [Acidimicrobiales bacterium]
MRAAGWGDKDVVLLHRAYEWALPHFSAQFRSSGKTFLAHLVGTASILAAHGAAPAVVAAGLIHAAYAQGDWGDGAGGHASPTRQSDLAAGTSAEVERLVERYTHLRWNSATVAERRARLDAPANVQAEEASSTTAGPATIASSATSVSSASSEDADIVLMRLANLLEDYLDLGMAYCGKGIKATHAQGILADAIALAHGLGHPRLAEELRQAIGANADAAIDPALRRQAASSALVAPPSLAERPVLTAQKTLKAARSRLAKLVP